MEREIRDIGLKVTEDKVMMDMEFVVWTRPEHFHWRGESRSPPRSAERARGDRRGLEREIRPKCNCV